MIVHPWLPVASCLLLSGCCCGLDWLIPDSVGDRVGQAVGEVVVEKGIELATGAQIDASEGRVQITAENGSTMTLGEGASALDARMPIAPFPGCAVAGGATIEQEDSVSITLIQTDCKADYDTFANHFRDQFPGLGSTEVRTVMDGRSGDGKSLVLAVTGDGTRFRTAQVLLGVERDKASANVTVLVPR